MVVDFSTMWCGVCRSIAGDTQAHQDFYTNLGYDFLWVTVLVDDSSWGNPPDLTDVQDWTSTYGIIDAPVLMGDRSIIDTTAEAGIPIVSWPTFIIIDEEMRITYGLGGWSEQMITDELESVLGL
jgi:thiol-disulfide isomerase/thioredoxin